MDSTRLVRVGGCLLGGNLLLRLVLLPVEPVATGPWGPLLFTLLSWVIEASLAVGAVMLVAGLVLRELGLLTRPDPAELEQIDHYG